MFMQINKIRKLFKKIKEMSFMYYVLKMGSFNERKNFHFSYIFIFLQVVSISRVYEPKYF